MTAPFNPLQEVDTQVNAAKYKRIRFRTNLKARNKKSGQLTIGDCWIAYEEAWKKKAAAADAAGEPRPGVLTKEQYMVVIEAMTDSILEHIIEGRRSFILPYRLGTLLLKKRYCPTNRGSSKGIAEEKPRRWAQYHKDLPMGWYWGWYWHRPRCKNCRLFKFRPARSAKLRLTEYRRKKSQHR